MKSVLLDKVASVALNCRLSREVRVNEEFSAVEGSVIAVRVLTSKSTYNQLELPFGRLSRLKAGDVIAAALGHRKALLGYSGYVPDTIQLGDKLHLLNLGGVLGVCDGINPDLGDPFVCEVLGQILHFPYLAKRIGIPAHISQGAFPLSNTLEVLGVPVIALVGTSMSSGKTSAACALIQDLTHRGLNVVACKTTGVSLRSDILAMEDAGAKRCLLFTDFGVVTTTSQVASSCARSMLTQLAADRPDVIVVELGDGLLGLYGVDAILNDQALRSTFSTVVLAANDPVGAWGGVQLLRDRHGLSPQAITGPATDNIAGCLLVERQTGIPCRNARTDAAGLAEAVLAKLNFGERFSS